MKLEYVGKLAVHSHPVKYSKEKSGQAIQIHVPEEWKDFDWLWWHHTTEKIWISPLPIEGWSSNEIQHKKNGRVFFNSRAGFEELPWVKNGPATYEWDPVIRAWGTFFGGKPTRAYEEKEQEDEIELCSKCGQPLPKDQPRENDDHRPTA